MWPNEGWTFFLASYQEGVGDENLYMSGFDIQQLIESAKEYTPEQLMELPAEEKSKIVKNLQTIVKQSNIKRKSMNTSKNYAKKIKKNSIIW